MSVRCTLSPSAPRLASRPPQASSRFPPPRPRDAACFTGVGRPALLSALVGRPRREAGRPRVSGTAATGETRTCTRACRRSRPMLMSLGLAAARLSRVSGAGPGPAAQTRDPPPDPVPVAPGRVEMLAWRWSSLEPVEPPRHRGSGGGAGLEIQATQRSSAEMSATRHLLSHGSSWDTRARRARQAGRKQVRQLRNGASEGTACGSHTRLSKVCRYGAGVSRRESIRVGRLDSDKRDTAATHRCSPAAGPCPTAPAGPAACPRQTRLIIHKAKAPVVEGAGEGLNLLEDGAARRAEARLLQP